jgi:GntR family transcriptional regulator
MKVTNRRGIAAPRVVCRPSGPSARVTSGPSKPQEVRAWTSGDPGPRGLRGSLLLLDLLASASRRAFSIPTLWRFRLSDLEAHLEASRREDKALPLETKDLAAVLGVNTNTVLRSLRLLRDEGLLEFRRGRGISVAGTPERGAVVQRARELVEFARSQGYRVDELVEIIQRAP